MNISWNVIFSYFDMLYVFLNLSMDPLPKPLHSFPFNRTRLSIVCFLYFDFFCYLPFVRTFSIIINLGSSTGNAESHRNSSWILLKCLRVKWVRWFTFMLGFDIWRRGDDSRNNQLSWFIGKRFSESVKCWANVHSV